MAWTAIGLLGATLGVLAAALFRLDSKIEAFGRDLGARIDVQGRELGHRIDALSGRIDVLSARVDAQSARIDAHLERHAG